MHYISHDKKGGIDSKSVHRFRDMKTLKYVLRSIEKNCPWYNKIYLITKGYHPEWLNINHEKIILINEEELFINKAHLPVFNPSAIEMNLSNLNGLSKKFIYLNDDMIIMQKLAITRFFINEKPVDFFHHGWIPRNKLFALFKDRDTWIHSLNNNLKLLNRTTLDNHMTQQQLFHDSYGIKHKLSNFLYKNIYKKLFWIEHWHHPQPYLKSTLHSVCNNYKKEMMISSSNRFRANTDLTQYIYRYWHLVTGDFEPYYHNDGLVVRPSSSKHLDRIIADIERQKHLNFVCFNDQAIEISQSDFEQLSQRLEAYLETKFPQKASFEL